MKKFEKSDLQKLYKPPVNSNGEQNGQLTIIGGSKLFHGAPLLSLRVASRIVDMVFFSSPESSMQEITSYIKADLSSFIWVDWDEIEDYIKKSDAILIGPGFMRYHKEKDRHKAEECDEACQLTKSTTEDLLSKFSDKKWVIDAGSLQTMDPKFIPENSILTPNKKEYEILFGSLDPIDASKKYKCVIVLKGPKTSVYFKDEVVEVDGGNAGLTKGGTGDVLAGLAASLLTKNDSLLSACASSYIVKTTADELYKKVGISYNSDDLADSIPSVMAFLLK
ncbi:NAD(P)H-hydrate dehydratase [Candidatus Woesebacteria bacterium]|nr:NAD(P)H-hydrate dehydratase [Candidatus Woesebacteria bacterium]QQG47555.1 MAG: NAD(P)H-hydrate dehydratase [Candidatus Woesebacteria bacterium]